MITLNGAKFLGLEQKIGSIEVGKLADLTAIDMSSIALKPVYSPVSQLIYNCTSANISNVWINGKQILQNGKLVGFNRKSELQTAVDLWENDNAAALVTYGEINTWDVAQITDMSNLFDGKKSLIQIFQIGMFLVL